MISRRQQRIGDCLHEFIDRAYHPAYAPTPEEWEAFFAVETRGRSAVTPEMLASIAPLLEAKGDYDLQIRMVYSECAEWWSKGWGWKPPLDAVLADARQVPALGPYVEALEKIEAAFAADSVNAIAFYTGFSQEEKNKYLSARAA